MEKMTLKHIENDRKITPQTDAAFLYEFQKAVLLALVESGTLTEPQYRGAEKALRKQCL